MWLIIGSTIVIILLALVLWIRHRLIMDTIRFYGGYGVMVGIHAYKKYGLWHLGLSKPSIDESGETKEYYSREVYPERANPYAL